MSTQVDRYLQQYELIDRYTSRLDHISRQTDRFAKKVNSLQKDLLQFGVGAAVAAGTGLVAFGKAAVDTAAKFERTQVTLESLTGSAERAGQILDFVRKLDAPSPFTFSQLADAATQLAAFNVPVERTLLAITKMGAAFPNKEMQDFVSLFGRLASGDFPDIEALSGVGLSKLDFMKEGIKFDAQGSLLSSSREAMDALDRIVNKRYGDILDKVANTTTAKTASAGSKWEQFLKKVGDALVKYVNPALDKLTQWIDAISKNQGFDKFLQRAAVEMLKFTVVVFEALAGLNIILGFLNASVKNYAGAFMNALGFIAASAAAGFVAIQGSKALKGLFDLAKTPAGTGPEVPAIPGTGQEFPDNPALKTLNGIEQNTRETAKNTNIDFKKYALGGGDIGQMGIQAIDRYRGRGLDRNRSVTINAGKGKVEQAMAEVARDAIEQYLIKHNGGR